MRYHGPHAIHLLAPMLVACLFPVLLFEHISYPLFWHDESDTVMFGQRVLGYPGRDGTRGRIGNPSRGFWGRFRW